MCGYADSLSICAQRLIAELLSRPQGRRARSSTQLIWVVGWFLNGYELATAKLTVSIAAALDLGPCIMGPQVSLSKSHFISQLSLCIMETHPSKSLFISQLSLSLLPHLLQSQNSRLRERCRASAGAGPGAVSGAGPVAPCARPCRRRGGRPPSAERRAHGLAHL